jgi:hypothetical protein
MGGDTVESLRNVQVPAATISGIPAAFADGHNFCGSFNKSFASEPERTK